MTWGLLFLIPCIVFWLALGMISYVDWFHEYTYQESEK